MSEASTPTLDALFEPGPHQFGVRGDLWVWQAMQERLTGRPLPDGDDEVGEVLRAAFTDVVGIDPDGPGEGDSPYVRRDELDHGGMSGGLISLPWWRDTGLPLLVSRAADLRG
jgi:hypothetical protein